MPVTKLRNARFQIDHTRICKNTYILLTRREYNDLKLLGHGVEEVFCEGSDIEDHLKGQVLQLLPCWLTVVLNEKFVCQLTKIVFLLRPTFEFLFVLHMRVDQSLV